MAVEFLQKEQYNFEDLIRLIEVLRGEGGCPWDREQTHASIRKDLLEECYELAEAIDRNDPAMMREELGDVLLQVVFHAGIESDLSHFSMTDVITDECNKMIIRHPHVFGEVQVSGTKEVLENWEEIKNQVKGVTTATETLKNVPAVFPGLMRAQKLTKRAFQAGLNLGTKEEFTEKLADLAAKLKEDFSPALLGKLLFTAAALSYVTEQDAEELLSLESNKFTDKFEETEEEIIASGKTVSEVSPEEFRKIFDSKHFF